jgi:hypothetical protein
VRGFSFCVVAASVVIGIRCTFPAFDPSTKLCLTDDECSVSGTICQSDGDAGGKCIAKCAQASDCAAGQQCMSNGHCATTTDFCQTIPHYTGTQVVNGSNDDFKEVPIHIYPSSALIPYFARVHDALNVNAQIAWDSDGLHAFFNVVYVTGNVILPNAGDPLWYGDSMELYMKSTPPLTGYYDGVTSDPGAIQILVTPDAPGTPRSGIYVADGETLIGTLSSSSLATQNFGTSYDVEVFLPWTLASSTEAAPSAGSTIGFDFGIDYQTRPPAAPAQGQQWLLQFNAQEPSTVPAACAFGEEAACDDRTWCAPILAP